MSTHESRGSSDKHLHNLERAIVNGDYVALSEVINEQALDSAWHSRDAILADALAISCEKGHHDAAVYLLTAENAKANLPSRSHGRNEGVPPLVLAVKYCERSPKNLDLEASTGGLTTVESLLKHGASLSEPGPDKKNALSHVLRDEVALALLASRAEPDRQDALNTLRDDEGNNALMNAILNSLCSEDVVLSYISHGADIHIADKEGRTTLMNAAWMKRTSVVKRLLQNESIALREDIRGRNIWHHISSDKKRRTSDEIMEVLFDMYENHASLDAIDNQGRTPLHLSGIFGTTVVAEKLLEKKVSRVHALDHQKRTPLHLAASEGHAEFSKLLLNNGAKRFAQCNGGMIPLHLVCGCEVDAVGTANALLDEKPEKQLESRTDDKRTPLHIAAAHGNEGIVALILNKQGRRDIDARCEGGWTALHFACGRRKSSSIQAVRTPGDYIQDSAHLQQDTSNLDSKYLAVVQALISAHANVNQKSRLSRTALHIAAEMGHVDIVRLLLQQKGVQFAPKDSRGNTPLIGATKSNKRDQVLELLSPWNDRFVESLPENVKQAAKDYDANIFDFERASGAEMTRHKIPVFDVLYHDCKRAGAVNHKNVSTRPDPSKEGAFRWIHLPANNLHWCHTLLTKHFIEGGFFGNVESFKALERSLSQQQYRGRRIHSRFMRPACTKFVRQFGDHDYVHHSLTRSATEASDPAIDNLKARGRVNSAEVAEVQSAPPSPKAPVRGDLRGLQPRGSELQANKNTPAHGGISKQLCIETRATIGQMNEVLEDGHSPEAGLDSEASQEAKRPPKALEFGACLFMPYLTLESKQSVSTMHGQLPGNWRSTAKGQIKPASPGYETNTRPPPPLRDARLHEAYSNWKMNDYCLHVRRTLDQFWYINVDTRERDGDQVVQRYQQEDKSGVKTGEIDSLMVDQLWIWVLGPSLIVTSFPQDWEQPWYETSDLLSSIVEEIDPRTGSAQSIYELAASIVGHCLSSCDQSADQHSKPSVLEMFGSSVGDVMHQEVKLFHRFKEASIIASQWVKQTMLGNSVSDDNQIHDLETRYAKNLTRNDNLQLGVSRSSDDRGRTATDEPKFVEDLLDIHFETELLEEVKDIQDELGILLQVLEDQRGVHRDIVAAFDPVLRLENGSNQSRSSSILDEQCISLDQQKVEIDNMMQQIKSTYKSITDLLDHKQKHANAIEARYARKQAVDTAKSGRTLMVFTIVTVVFLPLSFLAAFFTININELPLNAQDKLSLGFIMKYVVGVGLGTAVFIILVAWHHHRAVRWYKSKVTLWWRKQIAPWMQKRKVTSRRDGLAQSSLPDQSSRTDVLSPASSDTLRSRKTNVHNDLEMGGSDMAR